MNVIPPFHLCTAGLYQQCCQQTLRDAQEIRHTTPWYYPEGHSVLQNSLLPRHIHSEVAQAQCATRVYVEAESSPVGALPPPLTALPPLGTFPPLLAALPPALPESPSAGVSEMFCLLVTLAPAHPTNQPSAAWVTPLTCAHVRIPGIGMGLIRVHSQPNSCCCSAGNHL